MLNNNKKSQIPDKDLSSRKVIDLSFTYSGAGIVYYSLFILFVTGIIRSLPISLVILGIGTIAIGLYLLFCGNKKAHNNSDNNNSEGMNVLKEENYNNRLFHCNEHNEEINKKKHKESKLIKTDTKRNQNIKFNENTQNSQIHDHNVDKQEQEFPIELEDHDKSKQQPAEKIPPIIPIIPEHNDKLKPQSMKILTELNTIQKPELKPQSKPVKGISTIPVDLPKPEPKSQPAEGILQGIPMKLENNNKSESHQTEKIFAKLDAIHNHNLGLNTEPKPAEKQELPPKPESPNKPDPEPEPEPKPAEEIQIREKFLEYIFPENNKKNANQEKKQKQGRNVNKSLEIPVYIQNKINLIIEDNENAFRIKKNIKNKTRDKELKAASSKLNELFINYVLDVTKTKDKEKYTTMLSNITFKMEGSITKVSCKCQIIKDQECVFDFEFLAEFREDLDDNQFISPWKFQFKFEDKSKTPRVISVNFPNKKLNNKK